MGSKIFKRNDKPSMPFVLNDINMYTSYGPFALSRSSIDKWSFIGSTHRSSFTASMDNK